MSLYLMADSEYQEFKALEAKSLEIDAAQIVEASALASKFKMDTNGDTASIRVEGVLTPKRIGFLDFFGKPQTVWGDIQDSIIKAESQGIRNFDIYGDSGGGNVDGMFEAMDTLAASSMNTRVIVTGQAQSAMYMLASQAKMISATKPYNMIGSVGVKTSVDTSGTEISNTDSPRKISGAADENGRYPAQDTLDEIYGMILPRMASGRNTTVEKINSDWGKGGTMTAKTALARGMIDMIEEPKPAGRSGVTKGKTKMDMATLKAEHPDLYKATFEAGKEAGAAEFKEMAEAHLSLAEASGAMDRAIEDIKAGNPVGPKVFAFHNAEGIKRAQIQARGDEAPPAVGEGADPQAEAHADKDESADIKAAYAAAGLEIEL